MIGQGLSNKRIARALEISPETVKSHVKHIFLKLAVNTRAEAVSRAGSLGAIARLVAYVKTKPVVALSPR
jgi:LuxR family maltose regulon positive regulatory protein